MTTIFKVYYTDPIGEAHSEDYTILTTALRVADLHRKGGMKFVTMVSESTDMVGQVGSAGVENGKLPNGEDYTYRKGDALSQRTKVYAPVSTDNVEVKLDDE